MRKKNWEEKLKRLEHRIVLYEDDSIEFLSMNFLLSLMITSVIMTILDLLKTF